MSDWMNDFIERQNDFIERQKQNDQETEEISQKILELLKGVDRVGSLADIFTRVFEHTETESGPDEYHGFNNNYVAWGIERYACKKLKSISSKIGILYNYCVYNGFSEDNMWEFERDSNVCYIESSEKKVLFFKSNYIQYVVVFNNLERLDNIHIREVYESLLENDDKYFYSYDGKGFNSVSELREGLKSEKGLEIALANNICEYSDSFEGMKYPQRIDLNNMKKHNFDKECRSFMYGDNRDKGYIMSISRYDSGCELMDIDKADYVYRQILTTIHEIPESYIKKEKRKKSLYKLLKDE